MKNKDIKENFDLYGYEIIIEALKQKFSFVSFAEKSIPTTGSPCYPASVLKADAKADIKKVICHRDGTLTLKTTAGNLKFWQL